MYLKQLRNGRKQTKNHTKENLKLPKSKSTLISCGMKKTLKFGTRELTKIHKSNKNKNKETRVTTECVTPSIGDKDP